MTRVQFEVNERQAQEIQKFVELSELSSRKDLMMNMLSLWRWAVDQSSLEREISSIDPSSMAYYIVHLPALKTAADKVFQEKRPLRPAALKAEKAQEIAIQAPSPS